MAKKHFISRLINKIYSIYEYFWKGIWREQNNSFKLNVLKTINLSIRSFFDSNLQRKASALTYNTILAAVPVFALLFAIGRGFGFQNLLQNQLYTFFPAQSTAISTILKFVDSYLQQASQGIFVGIGIVFLLWTLISLLGNIEKAFNDIWGLKKGRSFYRKLTDYTAIFFFIPILMICSAGVSIFMSETIQNKFVFEFLSPLIEIIFDIAPFILTCGAFTLSFLWIPNTKVEVKYAIISGIICGIAFQVLQFLFVSGQIYVSKYNAIYGSFAFIPLLLIWLQLSWLILLFGCLLTYSSQNIFRFEYTDDISHISERYLKKITIIIAAVLAKRFWNRQEAITCKQLSQTHNLPIRLVTTIVEHMHDAGIINYVILSKDEIGISPAFNVNTYTIGNLLSDLSSSGQTDFISEFDSTNSSTLSLLDKILDNAYSNIEDTTIKDISI